MVDIKELKDLADKQFESAELARKICEQKELVWDFEKCKEKGCKYTYRQKFHCGTYGCIHSMSEWTQNHIPYSDKYEPKEKEQ